MIVSGCAGSFVVPGSLGCTESPEPEVVVYFGSGRNSSVVYLVFEHFWYFAGAVLVLTIPIFLYILAKGTVWSPSTSFWFWWCCCTGGWLFLSLGLHLYGQFRICGRNGIVGRRNWPVFSPTQRGSQTFFLLWAKEC